MGRPRLVVLRALWLGDLLTAVPCLRALARAYPEHRRLLAAPAQLSPLIELTDSGFELAHTGPLERLPADCHEAEIAVNLHGRGPESHRLLFATRPRRLIAFHHRDFPGTAGSPRWRPGEHEAVRWCRLLDESGIFARPAELRLRRPTRRWPGADGATIVHPGAKAPERRWPAERWAAVARAEVDAGREVLITGSEAEVALARQVAALAGLYPKRVIAGRTDLAELAAVIAQAGRLVSADTGAAHLATALGTPSITLFGPVPPSEWGPLVDRSIHRSIWRRSPEPREPGQPDPGLLQIGPEEVVAATAALSR